MNAAASSERTLLLILPRQREIYPLSTAALRQAQASRRQLERDYRDALILDRDGTLRRIDRVEILGPWGKSAGRKLLSRLTDAWHISAHLSEPLQLQFEELKEKLAEYVGARGSSGFPELEEPSVRKEVARAILAAATADQIFRALNVPPPEEALDVL